MKKMEFLERILTKRLNLGNKQKHHINQWLILYRSQVFFLPKYQNNYSYETQFEHIHRKTEKNANYRRQNLAALESIDRPAVWKYLL